MIRECSILFFKGKAYLPTHAQIGSSSSCVITEPVTITEICLEALMRGLAEVYQNGHPPGPLSLTREFWKTYTDPLLKVTHAKSNKRLNEEGLFYTLGWGPDHILLSMPLPNPKDQPHDPNGIRRTFPLDTPVEDILRAILQNREEVLAFRATLV